MLNFSTHICYSKILQELIFVEFIWFYGILLKLKDQVLHPYNLFDQAFCRSTGRSTESEVGQPVGRPMCTNMHSQFWLEGRSTGRSTVQRALLFGSGPGRPGGRPARELCYLDLVSVDRVVDRKHNGQKYDRCAGRSTGRSILTFPDCQRADFW